MKIQYDIGDPELVDDGLLHFHLIKSYFDESLLTN